MSVSLVSYWHLPDSITLLLGGLLAGIFTYLLTFGVIALCHRLGWVEKPLAGKIHTRSMPRIGGVAIFLAFLIVSLLLYRPAIDARRPQTQVIAGHLYPKELIIYLLFLIASLLVVIVHVYDDIRGLKPLPKLLAQTVAVMIVIGPGFHYFHGMLFFGVHNPFPHMATVYNPALPWYQQPELTLFIHEPVVSWLSIPAILFTWFWIAGMMNAVNYIDGLDGLAAGIVAIVALFITIISWTLGQHSIALLSAIFTGAVVGFLPHNWNPARIIMGDSGSQFLGIALAVLSVMGGAKFALMLMLLGIPILDIVQVSVNRMRRGQHPMQRDPLPLYRRETHLHYRLFFGGLSTRQVCLLLYAVTAAFGFLALTLPRIYKFVGFALVASVMIALLYLSTYLQNKQENSTEKRV